MRNLPKNVLSSFSKSTNRLPSLIPKRHQISKPAVAAKDNQRILLRRLCGSGVDEDTIFSNISSKNLSSTKTTTECSPDSHKQPQLRCFLDSANSHYTTLSPYNFSRVRTPIFPDFKDYAFRGSCGGVVCFNNDTEDVVLWNPTTNEVKFLPHTNQERPDPEEMHPTRVDTCVMTAGFGFDSKSQDYKYVRWVTFFFDEWDERGYWRYEGYCRFPEIYSLKNDSWELITCPYKNVIASRKDTALVNGGHLYWTSGLHTFRHIISLDLSTHEFNCFSFPHTQNEIFETHNYRLYDFGGKLGVTFYPFEEKGSVNDKVSFELWVWNGGWWSKEFNDYVEGGYMPLGFSGDGRLMFFVGIDNLLHVYDIRTKKIRNLDIYCNRHGFELISYVETAFPLNGRKDDDLAT